jgi:glucose-6-phosphate-specific signal transduction histidine kinase
MPYSRHCRIHLAHKHGMIEAEVLSDGDPREQVESTARSGLGLAGLRERVCTLGGDLEAGPLLLQDKEHFRLSVALPLRDLRDAQDFQEERA